MAQNATSNLNGRAHLHRKGDHHARQTNTQSLHPSRPSSRFNGFTPNKWFKRGTLYRKAQDALRAATEPMTTTEIAAVILKVHGVEDASKDDVQNVALGIQHSLKNHEGKAVERVGEASPAKWKLEIKESLTG